MLIIYNCLKYSNYNNWKQSNDFCTSIYIKTFISHEWPQQNFFLQYNTKSSRQVMRIMKNINLQIISWFNTKLPKLTSSELHGRESITNENFGVKGLIEMIIITLPIQCACILMLYLKPFLCLYKVLIITLRSKNP